MFIEIETIICPIIHILGDAIAKLVHNLSKLVHIKIFFRLQVILDRIFLSRCPALVVHPLSVIVPMIPEFRPMRSGLVVIVEKTRESRCSASVGCGCWCGCAIVVDLLVNGFSARGAFVAFLSPCCQTFKEGPQNRERNGNPGAPGFPNLIST